MANPHNAGEPATPQTFSYRIDKLDHRMLRLGIFSICRHIPPTAKECYVMLRRALSPAPSRSSGCCTSRRCQCASGDGSASCSIVSAGAAAGLR